MKIDLLFIALIGISLINHYVLARIFKTRPFLSILVNSKLILYMGLAETIILILAALFNLIICKYILLHYPSAYLRTIFLIPVSAVLGYITIIATKKISLSFYKAYNGFLTFLIISCIELSLVIAALNIESGLSADMTLADAFIRGIAPGAAFTIVLLLLAGISERIEFTQPHTELKRITIPLLAACLLVFAFSGFSGIRI